MTTTNLPWSPHDHPSYDIVLGLFSGNELRRLKQATNEVRTAFIKDPRDVHSNLYADLTPLTHPEYAGTYRGTPGTSLQDRRLHPPILGDAKGVMEFAPPEKVDQYMSTVVGSLAGQIGDVRTAMYAQDQFALAAKLFYTFGLVHPFLDGNGHIQRLMFATAVFQSGSLRLLPEWTIHPRAYDIEMAIAFNGEDRLTAVAAILRHYVEFV